MAGHSKWANIKHRKARQDASRGNVWTKVIREITSLGLKEAKDMADNAPSIVKEAASKDEAGEIQKKLEEAGATVTLK